MDANKRDIGKTFSLLNLKQTHVRGRRRRRARTLSIGGSDCTHTNADFTGRGGEPGRELGAAFSLDTSERADASAPATSLMHEKRTDRCLGPLSQSSFHRGERPLPYRVLFPFSRSDSAPVAPGGRKKNKMMARAAIDCAEYGRASIPCSSVTLQTGRSGPWKQQASEQVVDDVR